MAGFNLNHCLRDRICAHPSLMENVKNNPWDLYLIIQGIFCTNPPHATFITCCPAQQELLIKLMIFSGREDLLLPWGVVTRFAEHGADQVRKRLISPFLLFHGQWPFLHSHSHGSGIFRAKQVTTQNHGPESRLLFCLSWLRKSTGVLSRAVLCQKWNVKWRIYNILQQSS